MYHGCPIANMRVTKKSLYTRSLPLQWDPRSYGGGAGNPVLYGGGQANLYEYVAGDPINWRDPGGRQAAAAAGAAAAAAAAGAGAGAAAAAGAATGVCFWVGYKIGELIFPVTVEPLIDMWFARGERNRTARPDGGPNPNKKFRENKKTGRWEYKDQNGKTVRKPPGWKPPP